MDSFGIFAAITQPLKSTGGGLDTVSVSTGKVLFAASQDLQSLALFEGTQGAMTGGPSTALYVRSLFILGSGQLDMAESDLAVDYTGSSNIGSWNGSQYTGVTGLIQSGSNDGAMERRRPRDRTPDALMRARRSPLRKHGTCWN